ncbi:hypothetical protein DZA65_01463 [Dickeya dianthicola]|uniref:Uncharacterized protein n=1 Tax=Dickeya dianthicola TaxID=204039 RepID=A0ABX9NSU5_9GAMM|nr:hypothetical protein [Dickeya dianthicola]AYC18357.1 hypothetical protein DZA65_01463 [Dickeya dianthicola]MBI0440026.1 hypothetical protein [Dickeya dianthicola]MBI0450925.1 hypothetical protein [Dickeya dianthicola]MBI0455372.1 hypothetical protein [Dickeya dianthicola]MBI0459653.1 hypothetical protein [Dickeya dianthicola]
MSTNWTQPVTFDDWESKLIDYFLRFGADGDAQDIRWFEVTPTTLAAAFANSGVSADEIRDIFQAYMSRIPDLPQRLESGMIERSNDKSPGYFTYLVMTLLVSTQFDAQEESNDFRLKLQNWLRTGHSYQNLAGVNAMWEALAKWLEWQIQKGEPYRRLNLPEIPTSWSHIGYTLRLAFPRKADLRLMDRVLTNHPQAVSSPRLLIEYFQSAIQKENVSYPLKQAFNEFKNAWFLGRRTLADMPFWRLRQRAIELYSDIETCKAIIDMRVDFDGSRCYFGAADENGDSAFAHSLSEALISASAGNSENLGKAVRNGLLFFHQVGHGLWRAIAAPDTISPRFHIALSCKYSSRISQYLNDAVIEDDWILTIQPLARHLATDILRALKVSSNSPDEQVTRLQFYDGIRVPGGWLGLPAFLPFIESDTQNYRVYASGENCAKINVRKTDGRLMSSMPLNGEFIIEPELGVGEKTPPWRRRARFFDRAVPHPALGESAKYNLEPLIEWTISSLKPPIFRAEEAPLIVEDCDVSCEHLLEAIYASGARGWEETELVELLKRVVDGVSPWHLIRCLHDAGLIEPRLRQSWKGRVWTLVKPALLHIRNGENSLVVVEGAVCASLIDDFQKSVSILGGKCFRRGGLSVWSPPVFGAEINDPVALSRIMEWPLVDTPSTPDMTPLSLMSARHTAELHVQAAIWDWYSGRFLLHANSEREKVLLTRHVHPGGRDHDLYKVVSRRKTTFFLSRTSAIIAASADAHRPIFRRIADNRFICLTDDCGLPDALATGLRRSLLRNSGPTEAGYVYPIDNISFRWLNRLLPGCFISFAWNADYDANHLVSKVRHSGGKTRLRWQNGCLALWADK